MNLALAFLAGAVVAGATATAVTHQRLTLRYQLDGYNRRRIEATNIKAVVETATEHAHEAIAEVREWTGELLEAIADRDRTIDRLANQPRHRARPAYGPGSIIHTYGHRRAAA